jgi:hypothetical protein
LAFPWLYPGGIGDIKDLMHHPGTPNELTARRIILASHMVQVQLNGHAVL